MGRPITPIISLKAMRPGPSQGRVAPIPILTGFPRPVAILTRSEPAAGESNGRRLPRRI